MNYYCCTCKNLNFETTQNKIAPSIIETENVAILKKIINKSKVNLISENLYLIYFLEVYNA